MRKVLFTSVDVDLSHEELSEGFTTTNGVKILAMRRIKARAPATHSVILTF